MNKILICLAVLLLPGIFLLYSQDLQEENFAFLLEGPVRDFGIPDIGENVIPCYRGIYSLNNKQIKVYYTIEEIPVFSEWENITSSGFRFYIVSENTLCYVNSDKWALFIKSENLNQLFYSFSAELTKKMLFFAKTEEFFKLSSFPAIININR